LTSKTEEIKSDEESDSYKQTKKIKTEPISGDKGDEIPKIQPTNPKRRIVSLNDIFSQTPNKKAKNSNEVDAISSQKPQATLSHLWKRKN